MEDGIVEATDTVHCPVFESTIVKVQRGESFAIKRKEHINLQALKMPETAPMQNSVSRMSYAERPI